MLRLAIAAVVDHSYANCPFRPRGKEGVRNCWGKYSTTNHHRGSLQVGEEHATIHGYEGSFDMKEGESLEPISACREVFSQVAQFVRVFAKRKRKLTATRTIVFLSSLVFRSGDTVS
nr:hypothetical protein [Tanacetum cinerariifolium]